MADLEYADAWVDEDAVPGERMPMLACRYCDCCWPQGGPEDHMDECLVPDVLRLERERDESRARADTMSQVLQPACMLLGRVVDLEAFTPRAGFLFDDAVQIVIDDARPILAKLAELNKAGGTR